MTNTTFSIFFSFVIIIFLGCKKDKITVPENTDLQKNVNTNVANNVITSTYQTLYNNAISLNNEIKSLNIGDEAKLLTIKNAWKATRSSWEQSEGFLYGPVDTEGIDPAIDSWPVDINAINNILQSGLPITNALLENNNEARGFHTIEYFIWGINGNKLAAQLTNREIEYLKAAAQNLEIKTQQLYFGWQSAQGNFAANFINAGQQNSIYISKKDALLEISEGLIIIADEVANGKIEEPLNGNNGNAKPESEESRFSNNSKIDFSNNIRSIQNVYLGSLNGDDGLGLSDIVNQKNQNVDITIKAKINEAIIAIDAIPNTFTDAIYNNRAAVQNAQNKVTALKNTLESDMHPIISNL